MDNVLYSRTSSAEENDLVPPLVEALAKESVTDLDLLSVSFPNSETVSKFCVKYSLNDAQQRILSESVEVGQGCCGALVEAAVARARVRQRDTPIPPPSSSEVVSAIENSAKSRRLMRELEMKALGTVGRSDSSFCTGTTPVSLAELANKRRASVVQKCHALFRRINYFSPRYERVFGPAQNPTSGETLLPTMEDAYFSSANFDTVGGYCLLANKFLDWLKPFASLDNVSEFEVSAYLRDLRPAGLYVPGRHRSALMWVENTFKILLYTDDHLVQAQCHFKGTRDSPIKAQAPSVETVKKLEAFVIDKKSPVGLCIIAGILLCMVHGVLRWSDIQRSVDLTLGAQLLFAKATMKRKDTLTPWVASRKGFGGRDWAGPWIKALRSCNMPGTDFVLFQPKSEDTFSVRPASYATVVTYSRVVLMRIGLSAKEALRFTLHGYRQVYPTLANQLGLESLEQEAIGHWKKGSAMPQVYDTLTNSLEIRAKQRVLGALSRGFQMGKAGEFFMNVSTEPLTESLGEEVKQVVAADDVPLAEDGEKPDPPLPIEYVDTLPIRDRLSDSIYQVRNAVTQRIHLWGNGNFTLCSRLLCGTRDSPSTGALFESSFNSLDPVANVTYLCQTCYGRKMVSRLPSEVKIRNYDEYKALSSPPAPAVQAGDEDSSDDDSLASEFSLSSDDDL